MIVRKVVGVVAAVFSIFCAAIGTVGVIEVIGGTADAGALGALVLLTGLGVFSGVGAKRLLAASSPSALPSVDHESAVLAIAAAEGGRVTIPEVAAKTTLTLDDAHRTLQALAGKGLADSIVTEDGVVIYQIKGLLGPAEKAAAVDLLDA